MPPWVLTLLDAVPKIMEWVEQKLPVVMAYLTGRSSQKAKDTIAGQKAALERQREVQEAEHEVREETKGRRVTEDWLKKPPKSGWFGVLFVAMLLMGCSAGLRALPDRPPPASTPLTRPALADPSCLTSEWVGWLDSVIRAQETNCAVIAASRGDDPSACVVR